MLDPEGRSADAPPPEESVPPVERQMPAEQVPVEQPPAAPPPAPPPDDWPALGYWKRIGAAPPPPPPPAWTRTYELPSARNVVSAGFQLALASNRQIRRASIYIGLLSLGALGPAIILLLVGIGRVLNDPAMAEMLATDPTLLFVEQPEILSAFGLVFLLFGIGFVLVVAIGVEAQAIAIALLAGTASGQPLRLWEAIIRARQVFWRLLGAGLMVGTASSIVSLVVTLPFLRPVDTNEGISFIGQMIGMLVVAPFAFAATGIVLGDVGAIESMRRSVALFQARKRITLVVTLFTLVTSAIQTFAIFAGLDVAIRVAEFLHLGLDQGGPSPVLLGLVVLAFIVAFGSLSFTVAAIVAAPQVAGFLGLTFYSGGLDRARVEGDVKPPRFRWVSIPMIGSMIALAILAGLGLPSMASFDPGKVAPMLGVLRTAARTHGEFLSTYGPAASVDDLKADQVGDHVDAIDIVAADYAFLPEVPEWMLSELFDCNAENVACGDLFPEADVYADGAYLFLQRMAGPPGVAADTERGEWGPVLALDEFEPAPLDFADRFAGASHAFVTRVSGPYRLVELWSFDQGSFHEYRTWARSTWIGNDLITLVPIVDDIPTEPRLWDVYAAWSVRAKRVGSDSLRAGTGPMKSFRTPPDYWLDPIPSPGI
jgi:hypothetical protein